MAGQPTLNLDLGELPASLRGVAAGVVEEAFPSLDPWLELARAAAVGDRRATEALVRGVGPRVHDVARAILGSRHPDIDDLAQESLVAFIRGCDAPTVVAPEAILGCPHEEGTDYPEGEACPACPFWAGRDRWAGLIRPGGEGDGGG